MSSSTRAVAKMANVRIVEWCANDPLYLRMRRACVHVCACLVVLNEAHLLKFRRHVAFNFALERQQMMFAVNRVGQDVSFASSTGPNGYLQPVYRAMQFSSRNAPTRPNLPSTIA
jgi:hypothetical protein